MTRNFRSFYLLSNEEFQKLSTDAKLEYLKQAVEAKKVIDRQVEEGLARLLEERKAEG